MKLLFLRDVTYAILGREVAFKAGTVYEAERYAEGASCNGTYLTAKAIALYAVDLDNAGEVAEAVVKLRDKAEFAIKLADRLSSTKTCHSCGSQSLVKLASQNTKVCSDCGHEMNWTLAQGQPPLV